MTDKATMKAILNNRQNLTTTLPVRRDGENTDLYMDCHTNAKVLDNYLYGILAYFGQFPYLRTKVGGEYVIVKPNPDRHHFGEAKHITDAAKMIEKVLEEDPNNEHYKKLLQIHDEIGPTWLDMWIVHGLKRNINPEKALDTFDFRNPFTRDEYIIAINSHMKNDDLMNGYPNNHIKVTRVHINPFDPIQKRGFENTSLLRDDRKQLAPHLDSTRKKVLRRHGDLNGIWKGDGKIIGLNKTCNYDVKEQRRKGEFDYFPVIGTEYSTDMYIQVYWDEVDKKFKLLIKFDRNLTGYGFIDYVIHPEHGVIDLGECKQPDSAVIGAQMDQPDNITSVEDIRDRSMGYYSLEHLTLDRDFNLRARYEFDGVPLLEFMESGTKSGDSNLNPLGYLVYKYCLNIRESLNKDESIENREEMLLGINEVLSQIGDDGYTVVFCGYDGDMSKKIADKVFKLNPRMARFNPFKMSGMYDILE